MINLKPIQGKVKFIAVPVPKDATEFEIINFIAYYFTLTFSSKTQDPLECGGDMVDIKMDDLVRKLSILGKLSELTEEQCSDLVHEFKSSYMDYLKTTDKTAWFDKTFTAKDSLKSLLQSNGLNLKSWIEKPKGDSIIKAWNYNYRLSEAAEDYLIILID